MSMNRQASLKTVHTHAQLQQGGQMLPNRTRRRDEYKPTSQVSYEHTSKTGSKTSYTYGATSSAIAGSDALIADVEGSNFASRRARGVYTFNDLDIVKSSRSVRECPEYLIGPHSSWGTRKVKGDFLAFFEGGVPQPTAVSRWDDFMSQAGSLALAKSYSRIDPSILLTGELLGDLDKTVSMLRRPFSGSLQLIRKMDKYKRNRLGKTYLSAIKASANAWLEYRYGWKPLIMDATAVMENAHTLLRGRLGGRSLVARAEERLVHDSTSSFSAAGGIPQVDSAVGMVRTQDCMRACAGVVYTLDVETVVSQLMRFGGLRAYDLPATIWERVPYSFVIDWFANVGTWLQSITPNPNVRILGNWVTTIRETTRTFSNVTGSTLISSTPATTYTGDLGGSETWDFRLQRRCNQSTTATPGLELKSLGALHSVDGLTLTLMKLMGGIKAYRH